VIVSLDVSSNEEPMASPVRLRIDVDTGATAGIFRLPSGEHAVDGGGVAWTSVIDLPEWRSACYYAAFQRHDPFPEYRADFPSAMNRVQPLPVRDLGALTVGGQFLLLEIDPDRHLALLPVSTAEATSWFASSSGELVLRVGNFGSASIPGDAPALAWGVGTSPKLASEVAWRVAFDDPILGQHARLRTQKTYPAVFEYLGWCTWERYRFDISEHVLTAAIDGIESSGLPIRYVLVDDGYVNERERQLVGFDPTAAKFPRGWTPVTERKREDAIRWFGRWVNFNGYWNGVALENALPSEVQAHLERYGDRMEPGAGIASSRAYLDALVGGARSEGFDFLKVDDQAESVSNYSGSASPVARTHEKARALEDATADLAGLMNCMAHTNIRLFTAAASSLIRCSEDYLAEDLWRAKSHLYNAFANMLWLGPVFWGDHDMFHSGDRVAGETMAISKALSGGPIYLSDDPADFDEARVSPLCWSDGRLLRPLAPAAPIRANTYVNPYEEGQPFIVAAPLANGAAALAAFNLTEPSVPVSGRWGLEVYREAFEGIGDDHPVQRTDQVVVYEWATREARLLDGEIVAELPGFGHRLWLVCPVIGGWGVIGRPDKYLSPTGVEILEAVVGVCRIRAVEEGPILLWSEESIEYVRHPGSPVSVGPSLWRIDFVEPGEVIEVRRHRQ
jgi:hypothetical protein